MKPATAAISATTALLLGLGGCGGDDGKSSAATTPDEPAATAAASGSEASTETRAGRDDSAGQSRRRGKTVKVMSTRYGEMLFDGRGRALYLFTREKSDRSRCYGACAKAWPPFFTRGRPRAGKGVDASLLGTSRRRGGRSIVTYNGHPLYYYVTDTEPGEVTCQNVVEFGGTWLVVTPDGRANRSPR